jgi:hypothetical protein
MLVSLLRWYQIMCVAQSLDGVVMSCPRVSNVHAHIAAGTLTTQGLALLAKCLRLTLLDLCQPRFLGSLPLESPYMLACLPYCVLCSEQGSIGFPLSGLGLPQ